MIDDFDTLLDALQDAAEYPKVLTKRCRTCQRPFETALVDLVFCSPDCALTALVPHE